VAQALRDQLQRESKNSFWRNVIISLLVNLAVGAIFFVLGSGGSKRRGPSQTSP